MKSFLIIGILTLFAVNASAQRPDRAARRAERQALEARYYARNQTRPYKLELIPETTITGAALIGGAFAVYAISNNGYADRLADAKNYNDLEKIKDRQSAINHACGASSVIGVIIIAVGIRRNYGVKLAENTYCDAQGSGISLKFKF